MATRLSHKKILIVRLVALGDLATTSGLLNRIRAEHRGAHVTWMVGRTGAALVRMFEGVDEVVEVDEKRLLRGNPVARLSALMGLWLRLLGKRFDLVLIVHADRRYRWLVPSVPARRIRMLPGFISGTAAPDHFVGDQAAQLLDEPGSAGAVRAWEVADVRRAVAGVSVPADASGVDVVLVPGGARNILRDNPLRRWPIERYAAVARALVGDGLRVGIIGDSSDTWVREAFEGVPIVDLIGRLSLPQTLKVLADARLVISHDTGPLHFARLVRAPTIALFGPTAPSQMIGEPTEVTSFWGGAHLACRPCYDGRDFAVCARNLCMEDISEVRVLAAARGRLRVPTLESVPTS